MIAVATYGDYRVRFYYILTIIIDGFERFRDALGRDVGQKTKMPRIDTKNRYAAVTDESCRAKKRAIAAKRYG